MKKRLKKCKLFSALLAFIIMLNMTVTAFAAEPAKSTRHITNEELTSVIDGVINWAKHGQDKLLNNNFLEMAGSTPGDWFPIGIGRYGYKDDYQAYMNAITANVTERYKTPGKLHRVKATEWHRISLAVLAMGGDPTNIGQDPDGNPINLIADGTYNRASVDRQGINGAIWALISLDSKRYDVPEKVINTRDDLIAKILKRQLADGGFAMSGKVADPDISAMAMQALAPYYYENGNKTYLAYGGTQKTVKQVVDEIIAVLSQKQTNDGDYFSWGTQNVESTVQTLVALCSLGIDPEKDERFVKNGKTLIDGIMKYRNGKDGGFFHSFQIDPDNPSSKPDESNSMATEQVLYGLVSYYRLRNNMRNLYDYRLETDQSKFLLNVNGTSYSVPFDKNTTEYQVELPHDSKNMQFVNIPKGPYDKSNVQENTDIAVKNGDKIEIKLTDRVGNQRTYTMSIRLAP